VRLDQIRHTYLHYILDAKALSRATTLERLSPLLDSVSLRRWKKAIALTWACC